MGDGIRQFGVILPAHFKALSLNPYSVNIISLSNKAHTFNYEFGDEFFTRYGKDLVQGGKFEAQVILDKHETFIEAGFTIKGQAALICDRSLDTFEHLMTIRKKIVFKYAEEEGELSDEIINITHDTTSLDLGQQMYELIGVAIPIKKLHPRFREEDDEDDSNVKLVYTSSTDNGSGNDDDDIDPRWEQLKKLK